MKIKKTFKTVTVLSLCLAIAFSLSACTILEAITGSFLTRYFFYFYNSEYKLEKNESYTFTSEDFRFEELPINKKAEDIGFSLSSDDPSVVSAGGKTITAIGMGKTRISAVTDDGYTAYAYVTVVDPVEEISIVFPFGNFLSLNCDYSIDAYVSLNGGSTSTSGYSIEWSIDGEKIQNYESNPLTIYKPKKEQSYIVTASVTSNGRVFSAEAVAGYYESEAEKPIVKAERKEINAGEELKFTVGDGDDYTQWFIDGSYVSHGEDLFFTPSNPGYYSITAANKGIFSETVIIRVDGELEVKNLQIGYYDNYPKIIAEWDSLGDGFSYEVVCENGKNTNTYVVSENKTVLSVEPRKGVKVSVRSLGDGKFSASATKTTAERKGVDAVSEKYINEKWFGGDYFIESENEFFEFFDYMMYFRIQPENGKSAKLQKCVYMAYDYGDFQDLMGRAFDYSGITGSYSISGQVKNNVADITIEFYTVNVPTTTSTYNSSQHRDSVYAVEMHKSGTGGKEWFENATRGFATVSTTDQMFRVAEKGFVPVPEENSSAASVYAYAENVLKSIISENSSDYEIAHAVYDYIVNKNTYDNSVTDYDIKQSVVSSAFYMESILSDGSNYGVCDAMSKTFSFLCNMAGVDAVRVTGYAGSSSEKGGHAWNKVKIDENWYVVDCTWGDATIKVVKKSGFGSKTVYCESGSHSYFLVTDEYVADTHVADLTTYPATTDVPFNYYATQSNDKCDTLYLQSTGDLLVSELDSIAEYLASETESSYDIESFGISRKSRYYAIEFSVCYRSLDEAKKLLQNSAFNSFYMKLTRAGLGYNVFCDGNVFIVLVSKNGDLYNSALASSSSDNKYWWNRY